jgi:stage II sporulation protein D
VSPPPPVPALEQQPSLQVPGPSLLVIGRGFGHGVGMSQWGALAMAQRGHSHAEILSHYYRGTRLSLDAGR